MSIEIKSGSSIKVLNTENNSGVTVNLPTQTNNAGYLIGVGEVDDGTVYTTKTIRPLDVSQDFRLRTGIDIISWQDTFNYTILNTSKYFATASTQTISLGNGSITLNNDGVPGSLSMVKTFKTFSLFNSYPLYADFHLKVSENIQAANVIEFGFGITTGDTTAPTEGAFFRFTDVVSGVIVNNGLETSISNIFTPVADSFYHYLIVLGTNSVEFWVDDVLRTIITPPATTGGTLNSNSVPMFFRNYNSGVVLAPLANLSISQIGISLGDMDSGKNWATKMVTNGQSAISAPDGQTPGQSANIINNLNPYTTALIPNVDFTNTYTSGTTLGGQFGFSGVTGSETDYILFAYLNPVGTEAISGKNLLINNINISTYVSGATTTGATMFQWSAGVGGTSVSLLTADSATSGTRAARRINLGTQFIATAKVNGSPADRDIIADFDSPLVVEPGTYFHVILKMPVATAVSLGNFRGIVRVNAYFE